MMSLPEQFKFEMVMFTVSVENIEKVEYIREGVHRLYRSVKNASPMVRAKNPRGGIWKVIVGVHHEKVIETFSYLYACIEMGYAVGLAVDPISAPSRLEEVKQ